MNQKKKKGKKRAGDTKRQKLHTHSFALDTLSKWYIHILPVTPKSVLSQISLKTASFHSFIQDESFLSMKVKEHTEHMFPNSHLYILASVQPASHSNNGEGKASQLDCVSGRF